MALPKDPNRTWQGMAPGPQPPNYYRLLGLPEFESRPEVIEAAAEQQTARLLAVPPEARGPEVQKLLAEIAAARLCLLQPARKLAYDEALRQQRSPDVPAPPASPTPEALPELLAPSDQVARRKRARGRRPFVLAFALAAVAMVFTWWLLERSGQPPAGEGILVIDIPQSLRGVTTVRIDGQPREVPPLGPVEFACQSHEVQVEVAVAGQAQWKRTVTLHPGRKVLMRLPWETVSAPDDSHRSSGRMMAEGLPGNAEAKRPALLGAQVAHTPGKRNDAARSTLMAGGAVEPEPDRTAQPENAAVSAAGMPAKAPGVPEASATGSPLSSQEASGKSSLPGVRVPTLAEFDNSLAEAWAAIQGGDARRGYELLLGLFKKDRGDLRVAFSLGLLEALVAHNWPEAEKRFALCQRMVPEHPAVLNNLALVRLRTGQEHLALRHWEALLAATQPVPPEVVQNLRRFQALAHSGDIRLSSSRRKALDALAIQAAQDGTPLRPNVGFLYLPLKLVDGQTIGWTQPRFYHDRWCVVCSGRGAVRCPDPDCARGTVRASASRLLYVDPLTRTRVVQSVPVRATCRVCKGQGWIDCKKCSAGIDPSLKDAQDPLAKTLSSKH